MPVNFKAVLTVLSGLLLLSLAAAAWAEETEQQKRLAEINAKVEAESKTLEETSALEQSLSKELKELQDNVKKLRIQETSLRESLEEKGASADKLRGELSSSQERLTFLKQASMSRLRTIYMQNHRSFLESVLLVSDQNNLRRHAYFLGRIREHDQKLLDELVIALLAKSKQAKSLSKVIEDQARLKIQISAQRTTLSKKLEQQEKVVRNLRTERTKLEESIASLKAQALRLETVLVSLTSKDEEPVEQPAPSNTGPPKIGDFIGAGLMALRGKLPPPVNGARQAAPPKDKRTFKEMVAAKGLHFECPAGNEVKAIAPGRVIYVGRMPGLGNLAIVDHGQRFYSLYGGVSSVAVSLGEDLTQGGQVAKCGGDDAARLYFEIRKNGTPVNVKDYLQPG